MIMIVLTDYYIEKKIKKKRKTEYLFVYSN